MLLPREVYPEHYNADQIHAMDVWLSGLEGNIPIEPGLYYDRGGDIWELREDGHWFDKDNETRPLSWNPILGAFSPWEKIA